MKKILIKGVILLLLIILTDLMIGQVFRGLYYKVRSGSVHNITYGIRDCLDEIVIMGDSEVKHGLISNMISDSLGMSCHNLGLDGNNIYFQYGVLKELLNRYTPEIIIISESIALEAESSVTSLFPYYNDFPGVKNTVLEIAPGEKYKLLSKAYIYNSLILKIIPGIIRTEPDNGGYSPLFSDQNRMNYDLVPDTVYFKGKSTIRSRSYYEKFVRLAVNSGCTVVILDAPRFSYVLYHEGSKIDRVMEGDNVIFLEYKNNPLFTGHSDLFYDEFHLNHKGSVILTNQIISDIREKIIELKNVSSD